MGKLKSEVLSLIRQFITKYQDLDDDQFISQTKNLLQHLSDIIHQDDYITINTDGSSKGNPGPAKIGIQFKDSMNKILLRESRDIGIKTNNQAEYSAILEALKLALAKHYKKVKLYSDSTVLVNINKGFNQLG